MSRCAAGFRPEASAGGTPRGGFVFVPKGVEHNGWKAVDAGVVRRIETS